jgi:hypothetical protein
MKKDIVTKYCLTDPLTQQKFSQLCNLIYNILHPNISGVNIHYHYKAYIGFSSKPDVRYSQHLTDYLKTIPQHPIFETRKEYHAKRPDVMYVLYRTNDKKIRQIEDFLIQEFKGELVNDPKAGGTGSMGKPPYYIYLIVMRPVG